MVSWSGAFFIFLTLDVLASAGSATAPVSDKPPALKKFRLLSDLISGILIVKNALQYGEY
jgi:hypothetical protein